MADLALSAVQTLFAALQCSQVQELCGMLGYKSDLKDLEKSVDTVKKVLLGAEMREGELSPEEEDYIQKLKDVIYQADDVFDEVLALAEIRKGKMGGKITKKVRRFFSSVNPLSVAYNVMKQIKFVRKELDDIANNHNKFGLYKFGTQSHPIRKRKPETYSIVNEVEVIGRDKETKDVVDKLLLESNNVPEEEGVGYFSIVGGGGLGKTTLAQLVFNDERIVKEFLNSRFWVCVSDHDKQRFDVKLILSKILELVLGQKPDDNSSIEIIQSMFLENLGGRKCLLVLDDIWNEDRLRWYKLRDFFVRLGGGSRILTTTRSRTTSKIVGDDDPTCTYEISCLSPDNSWRLFAHVAFRNNSKVDDVPSEFVDIGHKIVEKCCCVPLVLKVVASLLCGEDQGKWVAFENMEVARIKKDDDDNNIMSILKFSYLNLNSSLKSCFKYCAIFPKGFKLKKKMLVRLWEAQGYIVPIEEGQSIQDAGEEYFLVLLNRGFFQDVEKNKFGEIKSCRIHDFMHDLAQEVAINEVWRSNDMSGKVGEKVLHINFEKGGETKRFTVPVNIRSCLINCTCPTKIKNKNCSCQELADVHNWKRLRVLKIDDNGVAQFPVTKGKFLHLRFLDLSKCMFLNDLQDSITQLLNLKTLDLSYCFNLKYLPKDFSKLVNLQHLNLKFCMSLTHMPARMDKLTNLVTLTHFIVNEGKDQYASELDELCLTHFRGSITGKLNELQFLTELRGSINVIVKSFINNSTEKEEGGHLKSLKHIKAINFDFEDSKEMTSDQEAFMEKLEPHCKLKRLSIEDYKGTNFPKWCCSLIELESLTLKEVPEMGFEEEDLPWTSLAHSLHFLDLSGIPKPASLPKGLQYLTNLQELEIRKWSNLESIPEWIHTLSSLTSLKIIDCPKLKSLPEAMSKLTSLRQLHISGCAEELEKRCQKDPQGDDWPKIQHISNIISTTPSLLNFDEF